jgi:hypothetical protein
VGLLREFEDGDEDSIHQSDEDSGVFEDNGDNMPALLLQEKVDVQEKDDLVVTADSATKQPSTVIEEVQAAAVGVKRKVGAKNGVALAATACLVAAAAVLVVWR